MTLTSPEVTPLTLEAFTQLRPGTVFAKGETIDGPEGLNMMGSRALLRWVAKKGYADDWALYTHFADKSFDYVENYGDKVHSFENIENVLSCEPEVLQLYRH